MTHLRLITWSAWARLAGPAWVLDCHQSDSHTVESDSSQTCVNTKHVILDLFAAWSQWCNTEMIWQFVACLRLVIPNACYTGFPQIHPWTAHIFHCFCLSCLAVACWSAAVRLRSAWLLFSDWHMQYILQKEYPPLPPPTSFLLTINFNTLKDMTADLWHSKNAVVNCFQEWRGRNKKECAHIMSNG